jgi:hypothetical protein
LIIGSLVGMKIAPEFKLDPEIGAVGFSILSIFASYFVVKAFAQRLKEKRDFIPEVVKILSSEKEMECSENLTTTSV